MGSLKNSFYLSRRSDDDVIRDVTSAGDFFSSNCVANRQVRRELRHSETKKTIKKSLII